MAYMCATIYVLLSTMLTYIFSLIGLFVYLSLNLIIYYKNKQSGLTCIFNIELLYNITYILPIIFLHIFNKNRIALTFLNAYSILYRVSGGSRGGCGGGGGGGGRGLNMRYFFIRNPLWPTVLIKLIKFYSWSPCITPLIILFPDTHIWMTMFWPRRSRRQETIMM